MPRRIGVDLGGSWMRVGSLDAARPDGMLENEHKHASPDSWAQLVELLSRYNTPDVEGYGIAVAATNEEHARIVVAPNLPWLNDRNMRGELQAVLGKKVVVSNDMEAATEGEMARGVLKNYQWAIFDTISTGWGGNLVLAGVRVDGEPGHANVRFDLGYPCGCGRFGCNEGFYSGSAMERRILHILQARQVALASGAKVWDYFFREANEGATWATALLDDWSEGVARAWANVLNRVRPMQAIVYMGTTAENMLTQPRVQERLRATLHKICIFPEHKRPDFPILPAREEDRGVYGALIVYDRVP
jgi:predicted NBD/HSP70 family sugar kinase